MRRVSAVARAIMMVDVVTSSETPLKVSALAQAIDIPRNTAYELVATLVDGDVLSLSEAGLVSPGPRLLQWGGAYARTVDLVTAGRDVALSVANATGETVHIARLDGADVVYLVKEDGGQTIRMGSAVGRRIPAYATAVGKAILGSLPEAERVAYLERTPLVPLTPKTITDAAALRRDLLAVAETGVAFESEESTPDVSCVGAAVRDDAGRVVAGISIAALASRMTPERRASLSAAARDGATALSALLGYAGRA